jgi:2-polyprenyl-6-methoxyphenol hydroxylase-like FAD-dependent oxidoreductase
MIAGISGRGQRVLQSLDAMKRVNIHSQDVMGRIFWEPGTPVETPLTQGWYNGTKRYVTKCIPRDRLTSCLAAEIQQYHNATVRFHFNSLCKEVRWTGAPEEETQPIALTLASPADPNGALRTESADMLVGTDGAQSAVRDTFAARLGNTFRHMRYTDTNPRVYRTIPMHFPRHPEAVANPTNNRWRLNVNYSARTTSDINLDALPVPGGPYLGVVLYRPGNPVLSNMHTAADARHFFDTYLPMFSPVVLDEDLDAFARKQDSRLPVFSYSGPVLHQ